MAIGINYNDQDGGLNYPQLSIPTPSYQQQVPQSGAEATGQSASALATTNPYASAFMGGANLLLTGANLYFQEKGRRAQLRALRREADRQERIRIQQLAEEKKWKEIEFAFAKDDREFNREEYKKAKRIEFFNRSLEGIKNRINTDASMKQLLFSRSL